MAPTLAKLNTFTFGDKDGRGSAFSKVPGGPRPFKNRFSNLLSRQSTSHQREIRPDFTALPQTPEVECDEVVSSLVDMSPEQKAQTKSDFHRILDIAEPYRPIMIIPGFCSSGLVIEETYFTPWRGVRVWLNLTKLGFSMFSLHEFSGRLERNLVHYFRELCGCCRRTGVQSAKERAAKRRAELRRQEEAHKNMWVKHIQLSLDQKKYVWEDPYGIKVRVYESKPSRAGLEAIDFLSPGLFTSEATYVFGPLISTMREVGFVEGHDLAAAPYDFRLPPLQLEERDGYFSKLAKKIEAMRRENDDRRVILLAHSMGVKVALFFLHWVEKKNGRRWIDKNLEMLFAVGGPLLGSPKTMRGIISGERMGLNAFLSVSDGLKLNRGCGSVPWLFPGGPHEVLSTAKDASVGKRTAGGHAILNVRHDATEGMDHEPIAPEKLFRVSGIGHLWRSMEACFSFDKVPLDALSGPPPIGRVLHAYGYGLQTEICFFFQRIAQTRGIGAIDDDCMSMGPRFEMDDATTSADVVVKDGIGYEAEEQERNRAAEEREEPGAESTKAYGIHHCGHSGDGTVPYYSLAFSKGWTGQNGIKENRHAEIPGAEHRKIIRDPRFLTLLIQEACLLSARTGTKHAEEKRMGTLYIWIIDAWATLYKHHDDGHEHDDDDMDMDTDSDDDRDLEAKKKLARRRRLWKQWVNAQENGSTCRPRLVLQMQLGKQVWQSDAADVEHDGHVRLVAAERKTRRSTEWMEPKRKSVATGMDRKAHASFVAFDERQRLRIRIFHEVRAWHSRFCGRLCSLFSRNSGQRARNRVGRQAFHENRLEVLATKEIELRHLITFPVDHGTDGTGSRANSATSEVDSTRCSNHSSVEHNSSSITQENIQRPKSKVDFSFDRATTGAPSPRTQASARSSPRPPNSTRTDHSIHLAPPGNGQRQTQPNTQATKRVTMQSERMKEKVEKEPLVQQESLAEAELSPAETPTALAKQKVRKGWKAKPKPGPSTGKKKAKTALVAESNRRDQNSMNASNSATSGGRMTQMLDELHQKHSVHGPRMREERWRETIHAEVLPGAPESATCGASLEMLWTANKEDFKEDYATDTE